MTNDKHSLHRRKLLKLAAASLGMAALPPAAFAGDNGWPKAGGKALGRVVVIGAGYAGAEAAKAIRHWSTGAIEVVLVEQNSQFVSCPLSNLVLGGSKSINELTFGYDMLQRNHGIQWVQDQVTGINPALQTVQLTRGELHYDRLVIASGIDFMYQQLPMLADQAAQQQVPHAWKAGSQTVNLRAQLQAMADGGVFAISIPKAPYRCPPGPYERVCQVAYYFSQHKPKSKILVLDANPEIVSKKALFTKVWADMYGGMIDYRPNSSLTAVDLATRTAHTEFDSVRADVLNVIPPQRAGKPAQMAGAANIDQRWCEVDFLSYESKLLPNVHIIGDSVSAALPKSAHMATAQAKVCASAIVALMNQQAPDPAPVFANTCYSYVSDRMAMHVAHVYRYDSDKKVMLPAEGGGVSERPSELEGRYAQAWAHNIWSDVLS